MNKNKEPITLIRGAGGSIFRLETNLDLPLGNEQYIKDAKEICRFLIGAIPSGTYQEVLVFLKAYERNGGMYSYGEEFQNHFQRRLKKLNKESSQSS